ncbi:MULTISPECIES: NAD(P)/FAD-dependent oxidoreductase [Rhodococcus]|uniref:NAD(P)/FAD-dependent oxidoreductase n=1 Tax=Rhodococcus oxybenzonivorans TaxID=1990687 RepID=A0AAE4V122_9NOCA|nr:MULTISPECIES: NAD(P)/FAD-dependent oxidoreductase [Rhodococcus]MDV7240547.1 NAD(P)/FAD-dependent oxidoreductase [Rhodococcus oxybenzonivorans]MDV7265758.1 NAD(P)/FAD-dependent oxidoreductase [Rhodococcus oxybenzonivorans]MDV7272820.1 NAD(P)/FAD-dependent oxidoreductase [Rhodococcus oxybenzonivorans]MDV7333441.1 NAD(P)/FAD-dependent oxidoreductase [Rhodococcus oxybenzonivorans]MDV7342608.1 NAD(P)/FAD-dependent oxidoreductase [Rhodococcus oxybenzonivorans]
MAKQTKRHRVAVIGGGLGGVAMGTKLKRAGIDTFTIFEAQSGPGGTWWINDYPGCEVDVPSDMYSYSFGTRTWNRTHVRQPELLEYIQNTIDEQNLRGHFRFDTQVVSLTWNDDTHVWKVVTDRDEEFEFDVVVSAVGFLSVPKIPTWPGIDQFERARFHTAEWDHDYDYEGKTVAVVGVGSTAAQVIPTIAPKVKQLYVFQREPGWVLPKGDRDYSAAEARRLSNPLVYKIRRYLDFVRFERSQWGGALYRTGSAVHRAAERAAREYIDSTFRDRPDLRDAVTPKYVFSGKRRVLSDDFYPALLRDNVELVPTAVDSLTGTGIVDNRGTEREVDLIVTAIGFTASNYLNTLDVRGRGGLDLHEVWKEGAFAFLGMTVPGFPNLYMLYGPNTNGGAPVTYFHERQADYVVSDIRRMARENISALEVKQVYSDIYNVWLQDRMKGTAWTQANNYFSAESGRIVTQWPDGMLKYVGLLRILRRLSSAQVRSK